MSKLIFINLPVTDLKRSMAFYAAIGAANNPQFTDETAACMVVSDAIHVMLLTHDKWRQFTSKPIVDAHASAQVLLCLSADSKDEVEPMSTRRWLRAGKATRRRHRISASCSSAALRIPMVISGK